nr:cytochrome oxidase assembly protein shy1 [Quercus suber]
MDITRPLWRTAARVGFRALTPPSPQWTCSRCVRAERQPSSMLRPQRRHQSNPADQPGFTSIVDNPPTLIRAGKKHNRLGLLFLAIMPVTAFGLGCWQVQRLGWKSELIAKFEDRLLRDPLPLPPVVDPSAIKDFDYRRVYAQGRLRHDQEMLIGPRLHDGEDGYLVVTPLERTAQFPDATANTKVLVNRGWIAKSKAAPGARPESLPAGEVVVEGLLREPWKKNSFTPSNKPGENAWYFPDVHEMAAHTDSQPVWIEATMKPDLIASYERESRGIPIGRAPEVNLRNNHGQ